MSVCTSWTLAQTVICPFSSCFGFKTSFTTSPLSTVAFFEPGSSRVEDTMYLGRLLILLASSPLRDGHRAANHLQLRRPSSSASVSSASSSVSRFSSRRSLIWPTQPPGLKPFRRNQ
jgi:hypothetical protein